MIVNKSGLLWPLVFFNHSYIIPPSLCRKVSRMRQSRTRSSFTRFSEIGGKKMRKLVLLFVLAIGCKPSASTTYPSTDAGEGPVLETLSWNGGEAPGVVSLATPRLPAIAEELEKISGIGIACFQELWTQESKDAVIQAMGPEMYYYYIDTRGENQRDGVDVCTPDQAKNVAACARDKCSSFPAEEQTLCVYEECKAELRNTYIFKSKNCVYCLVAGVGKSIEEILDNCVQQPGAPKIAGMSRAFDGQSGVLVASRLPLRNPEVLLLPASFSNRVAVLFTVEIAGFEPIEAACAHISTSTDLPPNHPDFDNWDEEMIAQVNAISAKQKERAGNRPQLFLVDLNAGPQLGNNISETSPKVWRRVRQLGYSSPAAQAKEPFCTICKENTLREKGSTNNYLIDHVLVRDPPGGTTLRPVVTHPYFDQRRIFRGYNGEWVDSHLSDHYGTVVKFNLLNE